MESRRLERQTIASLETTRCWLVLREQAANADGSALIQAVFDRAATFAGGDFQDDATVVVMSIR